MIKTAAKLQFYSLKNRMKLITVCLVILNGLILYSAPFINAKTVPDSGYRQITWPEIESLLSKRGFVSQEELF